MRRQKGAGTVVRIHGKWKARWTVNGERVYGEPRLTRDEAERDRLNDAPRPDVPVLPKNEIPTFQNWVYVCQVGRYGQSIAKSTRDTNETYRLVHLEDTPLGKKRINRITRTDCQAWIDGLRANRHRMEDGVRIEWKEKPMPATTRRIAGFISAMFSLAVEEGFCRSNPMKGVTLPAIQERENRVLTEAEGLKLMDPTDRMGCMMLVAMMTGMERSALRLLQWSHVEKDKIHVPGTKNRYRKAPVPCTPEVYEAIARQPRRSVFVFTTESGKPLSARNIDRDFRKRMDELGLPKETRLHDLRGSFITWLIDGGANPKVVQRLARHGSVQTTLKQYARSVHSSEQAAVEMIRLKLGKKGKKDAAATKKKA